MVEEPSTTPPTYEAIYREVRTQELMNDPTTLEDAEDNLTSIYEEEQEGLFGGISLFYFLIHSSFSALFPFLSIILYHHGFTYSQIGVAYTLMFFVSCFSATGWRYIADHTQTKHTVMLFSVAAWILGYIPLLWIKHGDPVIHCNVSITNNTSLTSINQTEIFISTQKNTTSTSLAESKFEEWLQVDYTYVILIVLLGVGRLMQCSTDYFYFDHNYLLYPESVSKKFSKPSYHISTRVSAAIVTLFSGYVLDSVVFCNQSMGHFKMIFYFFIVFGSFALFILYFLDINQFQETSNSGHQTSATTRKRQHTTVKLTMILKICTTTGLVILGATRAVYYTFLQLHLAKLGSLYFQIGAVFTIHKIVETCTRMSRKHLFTKLNFHLIFIIIFTMDSIRNLYISYLQSGLRLWLLLPMELLSGFSALLYPSATPSSNDNLIGGSMFSVPYWWIGFSFGPIIFGFGCQKFSGDVIFKIIAFANLTLAVVFAVNYFVHGDSTHDVNTGNDDDELEENEFLMVKSRIEEDS